MNLQKYEIDVILNLEFIMYGPFLQTILMLIDQY